MGLRCLRGEYIQSLISRRFLGLRDTTAVTEIQISAKECEAVNNDSNNANTFLVETPKDTTKVLCRFARGCHVTSNSSPRALGPLLRYFWKVREI